MMPVIGLDVDGVLADFCRAYREIAHSLHGVPVHGSGAQLTWHPADLTEAQDAEVWRAIEASDSFWRNLDPVITHGDILDLRAIERAGVADFVYVTARHRWARSQTLVWLARHGLPAGRLHMTGDKAPVLAKYPGLVGFLDDSPHGVATLHAAGAPVYVRDWPYNRDLSAAVPRVGGVGEYLHAITPMLARTLAVAA